MKLKNRLIGNFKQKDEVVDSIVIFIMGTLSTH